jgi:CBS domain-containing protein
MCSALTRGRNVISIDENEVIRSALGIMQKHRVSGLAVTRDGKLVGSFSSSDIKNLGDYSNILSVVMLPVSWALEEMIPKPVQGFTYPISVKPSATVTELLDVFLKTKVHRVFIVDGETLVGVCSLTDVLKIFDFTD